MDIRKPEHILLISICVLMVMPLLYIGRSLDTNSLTSWRWVFSGKGIVPVFFLLFPAVVVSYFLSRIPLTGLYAPLFLFVVAFASILPLWMEPETIIDASRYFVQSKALKEYGVRYFLREWGNGIDAWTDLPLVPFLYGMLFSSLGEARIYIEAVNSFLLAMTGILTFLIGKKLWDEETGLQAGILLLGIPYLLVQVPLMLVDVPTMFFMALAVCTFLSLLQDGGPLRTAAAAAALFFAVFSKYSAWPMLLVIPVISAAYGKKEPKKTLLRTTAVVLLAGLAAAAVIVARADLFEKQIALLTSYQWSGLKRWDEGWLSAFLFQSHPFVTGLALYGMARAVRKKDVRFLVAAWFLVLVVLLPIKRIRYAIPLLPLFALMASYGLNRIGDTHSKRFIALCIAASSLVLVYTAYLPFLQSTSFSNLKHAGEYLNSLKASSVEVYAVPQKSSSGSTFPAIPVLDLFTDKKIVCPQEWPAGLPAREMRTSSMRFTWEMKRPDFYSRTVHEHDQVFVVISDRAGDRLLHPFSGREIKRFDRSDAVFKYQTMVTIYGK